MSTSYDIFEKGKTIVSLDEHSNKLDLTVYSNEGCRPVLCNLSPEEVIIMGLEMLKIASYWCDEDDFLKYVKIYLEKEGGKLSYMAGLLNKISTEGNKQDGQN